MKSAMALVAAGTLVLSGFAGCERAEDANAKRGGVPRNNQSGTGTPSTTEAGKTPPSTTTGAGTGVTGNQPNLNTQMHQQAVTAWKQQVRDIRNRVDQLKDKVDGYTGSDKEQIKTQFQQLQTQAAALDTKVQDFKETGTGSFDSFRGDVESSMTRISDQIRDLDQKLIKSPNAANPTTPPSPSEPSPTPDNPKTPDNTPMPQPTTPPNPNDPG